MRKMKNSKGFTLMEMLIVVAIIAVLVAIAIPTFTTSLNKARVATDEANIRSGYASFMAEMLANDKFDITKTYYLQKDGTVAEGTTDRDYVCVGNQADENLEIAGQKVGKWNAGPTTKVTYKATKATDTDKVTVTITVGTPTANPGQGG